MAALSDKPSAIKRFLSQIRRQQKVLSFLSSYPCPLRAGQLNHLHEQTMPGKKAMVVISNGKSTQASGALDRTLEQLRMTGVETLLFDKVVANPLKAIVEEGGRFARDNNCDFVVALGGGSVMDAAKAMAMYALQPGDLWDYVGASTGKM